MSLIVLRQSFRNTLTTSASTLSPVEIASRETPESRSRAARRSFSAVSDISRTGAGWCISFLGTNLESKVQNARGSCLATCSRYAAPPTLSNAARIASLTIAPTRLGVPRGRPAPLAVRFETMATKKSGGRESRQQLPILGTMRKYFAFSPLLQRSSDRYSPQVAPAASNNKPHTNQ